MRGGADGGDISGAERVTLDTLVDGEEGVVSACPSRKAREMGLAPGVQVRMMRSRRSELAVVVAVEDARFMVSRVVARQILVARGVDVFETAPQSPGAKQE